MVVCERESQSTNQASYIDPLFFNNLRAVRCGVKNIDVFWACQVLSGLALAVRPDCGNTRYSGAIGQIFRHATDAVAHASLNPAALR